MGSVYADGELVHNKSVMEDLAREGIGLLGEEDVEKIGENDCVIIRAHGVSVSRRSQLEKIFKHVVDGTCPHVAFVAEKVRRASDEGRSIVIIGDGKHPEVIALAGGARQGTCFTVNSEKELESIPPTLKKVLIIAQSTVMEEFFLRMAARISKMFPICETLNTVCAASRRRQKAVLGLKQKGARAIVVVGGRHSNNTLTLVRMASATGLPTFHIEDVSDLRRERLEKFSPIGVIAGASTGEEVTQRVIDAIEKL
jgi:4-hydroxy-3-methylbut-2-enyl diphosphate reductase